MLIINVNLADTCINISRLTISIDPMDTNSVSGSQASSLPVEVPGLYINGRVVSGRTSNIKLTGSNMQLYPVASTRK